MPTKKPNTPAHAKPRPNTLSEVAPGVFVGGWKDALAFEGVRFCVLDEAPEGLPPFTHMPFYDEGAERADPKKLDRLAAAVRAEHAKGETVLIFCGHGVRRSPLGAAWYLRRTEGLPLDAAFDRVRAVRPNVQHPREWAGNADELARS